MMQDYAWHHVDLRTGYGCINRNQLRRRHCLCSRQSGKVTRIRSAAGRQVI